MAAVPRGRFAPSPTGPLHFGSLIAALASYCDVRAAGGEWLVRIEDVDAPRSRIEATRSILRTLARYGFRWDGEVVRQAARTATYDDALANLRARSLVFDCACTRRDMERAPLNVSGERIYPGTCRHGVAPERRHGTQLAQRVRVADTVISFVDLLQGRQQQDLARDVGDFIVRRADGLYAYQLAVVVDDALAGITSVVRGADLLSSTPRQIFLAQCLGLPVPEYLHVPVALNPSGEKLSKQTGAAPLPADPLPALLAAWQFLQQETPSSRPESAGAFLAFATRAWSRARLPPVRMLPAPRV